MLVKSIICYYKIRSGGGCLAWKHMKQCRLFFLYQKNKNRQSTGGCTHRPELGRKVVPMYVYNSFWSFSVCYYVMCSNYTGDYLQEAQIKTTTWPGKNSDRFYRLIFARSKGCVLPVGCLLRVLYHIIHKSQKRMSFKPRLRKRRRVLGYKLFVKLWKLFYQKIRTLQESFKSPLVPISPPLCIWHLLWRFIMLIIIISVNNYYIVTVVIYHSDFRIIVQNCFPG